MGGMEGWREGGREVGREGREGERGGREGERTVWREGLYIPGFQKWVCRGCQNMKKLQ